MNYQLRVIQENLKAIKVALEQLRDDDAQPRDARDTAANIHVHVAAAIFVGACDDPENVTQRKWSHES